MPRFFIDFPCIPGDKPWVDGENGTHTVKSLRMREGETLIPCDGHGTDYHCVLPQTESNRARARVLEQAKSIGEPSVFVMVHQSSPKADEMDSAVQRAVEHGACRVVPMLSTRCVSRSDEKAVRKKAERWQKIALEAAKQSDRGIVPEVVEATPYAKTVEQTATDGGKLLFFYKGDGQSLCSLGPEDEEWISLFIGPEGGLVQDKVELVR